MASVLDKINKRNRRKLRIRKKIHGTQACPRLSVFKSNKYLYLQVIDDDRGATLQGASTQKLGVAPNVAGGSALGKVLAEKLLAAGIKQVVLDRNGYKFHGVVKAIAESVRENGVRI